MSVSIEDDCGEIGDRLVLSPRRSIVGFQRASGGCRLRLLRRVRLRSFPCRHRARVEHRATFGCGDDGKCVGSSKCGECRAIDRIDGDVDPRGRTVPDPFTVVEHRRLVLFAFADDDEAVHRHNGQLVAHGVDGCTVGCLLVAASPMNLDAAMAATSVTRTSSRARFLSGVLCSAIGVSLVADALLSAVVLSAALAGT